jgi:peptidyl-prolyl cis-trans isomerase C
VNKPQEYIMIAKVNGTAVSAVEVDQEVKAISEQYQQQIPPDQLETMIPELKKRAVESIINRHLLYEEVDRKNIVSDPDRIKEEVQKIASQFQSQAAFEEQLASHNISLDQMEKDLGMQFRVDALIREYVDTKSIQVAEEEIVSFYESNPESFQSPEERRASHILLKCAPEDPQEVKTQKRLELAGILGRIEKGADFSEMAQSHSDCPSKQKGGDLGLFGRGSMVKPFEEAAFNLNPNEVSDIIETEFGYHLIKLTEKKEARKEAFDTVKEQISNHLMATKEQAEFQKLISELRKEATIEYVEEA